jgi:hypothetical protein
MSQKVKQANKVAEGSSRRPAQRFKITLPIGTNICWYAVGEMETHSSLVTLNPRWLRIPAAETGTRAGEQGTGQISRIGQYRGSTSQTLSEDRDQIL